MPGLLDPGPAPHRPLPRPTTGSRPGAPRSNRRRPAPWRCWTGRFGCWCASRHRWPWTAFAVDGLPDRPIPLDELRSMLLHPSVGFDTRDTALTWLVGRAQTEGGAWLVGLAGVLLPGIGRRVYPLCRAYPRLAHDLEAEALAGLLQAVQGVAVRGRTGWRPGWSGRPPGPRTGCCAGSWRWQRGRPVSGLSWSRQPARLSTASWSWRRRSPAGWCRGRTRS